LVYFILWSVRSKGRQSFLETPSGVNTGEINGIDIAKVHNYQLDQSDNFALATALTEAKI
jgi:hypothetical protein